MSDQVASVEASKNSLAASFAARGRFMTIVPVFGLLLLLSAVVAPSTVQGNQLSNMLYFGAILGVAALGQHIVVIVGGLDLSVGPVITLSALVFATNTHRGFILALLLACASGAVVGVVNGVAVTRLRVTPLIATLGGGALATGLAYSFSGQGAPTDIPASYGAAISNTFLGIPMVAYGWVVGVLIVAGVLAYTVTGRQFTAVGANPGTSRVLGIRVDNFKALAYLVGGLVYAIAGVLVAIAVTTPGLRIGDPYLLPSIAAVVIGGTRLGGGVGSIGATSLGALFVTQLNNFTLAVSGSPAIQQIVQGAVIVAAMAIYGIKFSLPRSGWRRNGRQGAQSA